MRKLYIYITWDPSHSPYREVRVISNHPGLSIDGSEPLTRAMAWPRGQNNPSQQIRVDETPVMGVSLNGGIPKTPQNDHF